MFTIICSTMSGFIWSTKDKPFSWGTISSSLWFSQLSLLKLIIHVHVICADVLYYACILTDINTLIKIKSIDIYLLFQFGFRFGFYLTTLLTMVCVKHVHILGYIIIRLINKLNLLWEVIRCSALFRGELQVLPLL